MCARARASPCLRGAGALAAALALACVIAGGAHALSAVPQSGSGTVVVDGTVNSIATVGSTLYLGGSFTHVGSFTGAFASAPAGGGAPASLPPVNGTVAAVVPDGAGGWYVGGGFTSVGSASISNLAHITSGGAVDTSWAPSPSDQVDTLALAGGTLYVGGRFTTIGGTSRDYLAALTAATGAATNWNPQPDGEVTTIVLPSGAVTLYAAGNFTTIGGASRAGVAAIATSTGSATTWNPNPTPAASVNALAVSPDGTTVYAGGTFTAIGGNPLTRLAAISASTGGSNASWTPAPDNTVNALAVSSDGATLYVGGAFALIGSTAQTRNFVAAVSTANPGNPTSWDPSLVGSTVTALALSPDGKTAYLGGTFTQAAGQARLDLAAVATGATATATAWQEDANAAPNAIAATSSAVGVGGAVTSVGMASRSGLAAVSTSGVLQDFNPGVTPAAVNVLAVSPDSSTLYVGGSFTTVGGVARSRLAAVTLSTGVTTSWKPTVAGTVDSLEAATIGSDVYVYAGLAAGTPRLQVFLGSSGAAPAAWVAPSTTTGTVEALAFSPSGAILYVGGSFTNGIGTRIAALDSTTGAPAAGWTVPTVSNGTVQSLAVSSDGSTLYLGGSFINPSPGQHLVGTNSAGAVTWNGNIAGTGSVTVYAIALSGTTVYAGGTFVSTVGSNTVVRTRLAAFDSASATASSWNPAPNSTVQAVAPTSSAVFVGGLWTTIGGVALRGFAGFALSAPAVTAAPAISGTVALGSTLTCSTGAWTNAPTSFTYQWLRGGSAIGGATSATYVAGSADVNQQLSCQVTATNGEGSASATSASVTIVSAPTNTAAPIVSGTVAVGAALSCNPGTWTGSPSYAYVWLRDGKTMSGAASTSYTPVSADIGHALSCTVTGTNSVGSAMATSAAVIVPAAPISTPVTIGTGVGTSVGPGQGGTLSLPGHATVTWAAGTFAGGGTIVVSPVTLASGPSGFSSTSPIVSVAYTAPGASQATAVFLPSPISVVLPAGVVPRSPYVAISVDGVTFMPVSRLAKEELPSNQTNGWLRRPDGSIVVYTRHTGLFALLRDTEPPTRPATLVAALRGTTLRLRWAPAADNSRVIALCQIVRGATVVAKVRGSQVTATFSVAELARTSVYRVRAIDPAGNIGLLSSGIEVVVAPRPQDVPRRIPSWAKQLRLWHAAAPSVRGPRPVTPSPFPKWYAHWTRWMRSHLSIRPA